MTEELDSFIVPIYGSASANVGLLQLEEPAEPTVLPAGAAPALLAEAGATQALTVGA